MHWVTMVLLVIGGASLPLAVRYIMGSRDRELAERRYQYAVSLLEQADRIPGGKEFIRVPYNSFCSGFWLEKESKFYPRLEYRHSVGVVESEHR